MCVGQKRNLYPRNSDKFHTKHPIYSIQRGTKTAVICIVKSIDTKKKVNKKKSTGLLYITRVCETNAIRYDFLKCPLCKRGRLCDVLHGGLVIN